MAESIRCPHCGKTYVMKPELAGKQVCCRQCQKPFTVTAPKPPDDGLEEPILLTLAPDAPAAPTGTLLDLNQNLASGPTIELPGQGETLAVGSVLPLSAGQPVLRSAAARRQVQVVNVVFQRLQERKLSAAVAIVSLGLMVVFILLFFAAGLPWFFVVPPMVGIGLAALGCLLPVAKRRGRRGPWLDPTAGRIAAGSGIIGLILVLLYGIMIAAAQSGHAIPTALGLSHDSTVMFLGCFLIAIGAFFAACFLTIMISVAWSLSRRYGLLQVTNILYLGVSPVILAILCVCGIASNWMRSHHPVVQRQSVPSMNQQTGMPPGWPHDQMLPGADQMRRGADHMPPGWPPVPMRPGANRMPAGDFVSPSMGQNIDLPPGAMNPYDPDFYRVNLAELRSADVNHRRIALLNLSHAQPNQLREEIAKALELLVNDSDVFVRRKSLETLSVWSTGDIVPIAICALKDPDMMVRGSAIEILEKRKDPRAIEPLVALLSDPSNPDAAECLEQMGSTVEDAVLAAFDKGNNNAKRLIIQILGAVATEKGIAKLRKIAADKSDFSLSVLAKHALRRRGEQNVD